MFFLGLNLYLCHVIDDNHLLYCINYSHDMVKILAILFCSRSIYKYPE